MSVSRVIRLLSLALIAAALICVPATATAPRAAADDVVVPEPVNILAAGDSITHGRDGDWTWRYLLWKKFRAATGTKINFVGTRKDLMYGGTHYRETATGFSKRHYALYSRTFDQGRVGLTAELAKDSPKPDVVVVQYGTNDLGMWGLNATTTLDKLRAYLRTMRSWFEVNQPDRPQPRVVLVEVMNLPRYGAQFNAGLRTVAAEQNAAYATPEHPVNTAIARVNAGSAKSGSWSVNADTWDHDHHPNPSGDAKIANAIDVALGQLGVGDGAGSISTRLPWNPSAGMKVTYSTSTQRATVSWDPLSVDATAVDVQWRKSTGSWQTVARKMKTSWTSPTLSFGGDYRFQLVLHRSFQRSTAGASANYKQLVAGVSVSKTVAWDSNGKGRIGVACAKACSGSLNVWSGSARSATATYRVPAKSWRYVYLSGIPQVARGGEVHVALNGHSWFASPVRLSKAPAPNITLSGYVPYDANGNGTVNVSCRKACEGYVRIQAHESDTAGSSVGHFRLAAGAWTTLHLKGIPDVDPDTVWVRIALPDAGAAPLYQRVTLVQMALPGPDQPNVITSAAIVVDRRGSSRLAVLCRKACEGYAQVRVNARATGGSSVVHYKNSPYKLVFYPIGNVPTTKYVAGGSLPDAVTRVYQKKPVIAPNPQYRAMQIRPYVTVSKKIVRSGSRATLNVACSSTCTGWLQVWSDSAGTAKSGVVKYSVKAGKWKTYTIPNLPALTGSARVRLALLQPDAWGKTLFRPVR